jgi:centromeric protein E
VRIRPLLELEQLAHERVAWKPLNTTTLQYVDAERPQAAGTYQYNRVFPDATTSGEVYQAAARSLVSATMRGYNSTIFAYGQTGSGKTYTMQSIMHAAAEDVFKYISGAAGREFVVRLSAVEIYNEVVRDLLRDASPALRVQDDPGKGVVAEGLTEAGVQSVEHLRQLLREVEGRRQVSIFLTGLSPPLPL